MKFSRKRGTPSNMFRVQILDNTASKGEGLTGLAFNSTNLQISIIRELSAAVTVYTGANIENITTIGTYQAPSASSKCRFKEVDAINFPGLCEIHVHNDAGHFGAGDTSKNLQVLVWEITTTALNIAPVPSEIQLTAIDLEDAVRMGLTSLPNAPAEAAGGLYTRGSGAGQINQQGNGQIDSNVARWLNTAVTADTAGHPKVTIKAGSGYAGGVWIDDAAANANTVVGVDGLPSNPVSTLAAARTIADAIGIKKYFIVNDATLTLAAAHLSWEFVGVGLRNQINLGGQSVNDSYFKHIVLSGTQGGAQKIEAECCYLNGITDMNIIATNCWLTGNNTLAVSTLNILDHCSSNVPGGNTPELTFQAGVISVGIRHYSGGLTVKNMTSDHTMSFDADGQLIVDASCTSGNISARGNMKITDNGTTTNLTDEAVYNRTIVNAELEDVIGTDSNIELASLPDETASLREMIQALFQYFILLRTVTAAVETMYKADGVTPLATGSISDNGTTASFGKKS